MKKFYSKIRRLYRSRLEGEILLAQEKGKRAPVFVSVDGLDMIGKSTFIEKVKDKLSKNNLKVLVIHFPNSGPSGEIAREYLSGKLYGDIPSNKASSINPMAIAAPFVMDRITYFNNEDNIREIIDNDVVILDRSYLSTIMYQGAFVYDGTIHTLQNFCDFKSDIEGFELLATGFHNIKTIKYMLTPLNLEMYLKILSTCGRAKDIIESNERYLTQVHRVQTLLTTENHSLAHMTRRMRIRPIPVGLQRAEVTGEFVPTMHPDRVQKFTHWVFLPKIPNSAIENAVKTIMLEVEANEN